MSVKDLLACFLAFWATSLVDAAEVSRSVSVVGQGAATAPPDMATFETAVVTQAATAGEAVAANNEAAKTMIDVVKQAQIADKDVQTSQFDISPMYQETRDGRNPKIVGYQVTNQITVVVRNLPTLGKVLDAVVKAGSNQISGIRFDIDQKAGVLNQARNRAMSDARARAELFAAAAGVRLGKVLTIQETGTVMPQPHAMMRMAMAAEAAVPVATGEQELAATVSVTYEIVD